MVDEKVIRDKLTKIISIEDDPKAVKRLCSQLTIEEIKAMIKMDKGIISLFEDNIKRIDKLKKDPELAEYFKIKEEIEIQQEQVENSEPLVEQVDISNNNINKTIKNGNYKEADGMANPKDIQDLKDVAEAIRNSYKKEEPDINSMEYYEFINMKEEEIKKEEAEKAQRKAEAKQKAQMEAEAREEEEAYEANPFAKQARDFLREQEKEKQRQEWIKENPELAILAGDIDSIDLREEKQIKDVQLDNEEKEQSEDLENSQDEVVKKSRRFSIKGIFSKGKNKLIEFAKGSKIISFLKDFFKEEPNLDVDALLKSRAVYQAKQREARKLEQKNHKGESKIIKGIKEYAGGKYRDVKGHLKQRQLSKKFDKFIKEQENKDIEPELSMGLDGISFSAVYKIGETKDGQNEYMLVKGNIQRPQKIQHFNFVGNIDDLKNPHKETQAKNLKNLFKYITYPEVKNALKSNKVDGKFDFGKVKLDSMNNPILGNEKVNEAIKANLAKDKKQADGKQPGANKDDTKGR